MQGGHPTQLVERTARPTLVKLPPNPGTCSGRLTPRAEVQTRWAIMERKLNVDELETTGGGDL
jgi:hypothetical protein